MSRVGRFLSEESMPEKDCLMESSSAVGGVVGLSLGCSSFR